MERGISRLSPFRWTWEWLFLVLLPFSIFWHEIVAGAAGNLNLSAIERRGRNAEGDVTRISGGPSSKSADAKGLAAAFRRFEVYLVDLDWRGGGGAQRRVRNARVGPDAGEKLGFGVADRKLPMRVAVRYLDDGSTNTNSGLALIASELPPCEPAALCQVLVMAPDGTSGFDFFTRFWLIWGGTVAALCVAGFAAALGLRWFGRI